MAFDPLQCLLCGFVRVNYPVSGTSVSIQHELPQVGHFLTATECLLDNHYHSDLARMNAVLHRQCQ